MNTKGTGHPATPWHVWVVAAAALIFNAMGGYDYVMTRTGNAEYLASFPPEALAIWADLPVFVSILWGVGVWGAVLASLLLLLRSKWSFVVYAAALLAYVANMAWFYLATDMPSLGGTVGHVMTAVIGVILLLLTLYTRAMAKRGVLR